MKEYHVINMNNEIDAKIRLFLIKSKCISTCMMRNILILKLFHQWGTSHPVEIGGGTVILPPSVISACN